MVPTNRLVTVEAWITAVDDERRIMTADGFLSVDGKTIYQMNDFTRKEWMVQDSMKYRKVTIEALGYELAPVVVTSTELEARLEPLYKYLRIAPGQLQALTGIRERRWWEPGYPLSHGAIAAARKVLLPAALAPRISAP